MAQLHNVGYISSMSGADIHHYIEERNADVLRTTFACVTSPGELFSGRLGDLSAPGRCSNLSPAHDDHSTGRDA